jgi:hypothetical protein
MRAFFYTQAQIDDAFRVGAPKLRDYAAACRQERPLPDRAALTAAQREQYRILHAALTEFHDSPIGMGEAYLEIYHGSPVALLAAQEVFRSRPDTVVLLLCDEFDHWYQHLFNDGVDGWFGTCWVTIHDEVPPALAEIVAQSLPRPDGFCYWILTKARRGGAKHEVWKWNGTAATPQGDVLEEGTEEGFIDNFAGWDHSGLL